MKKLEKMLARVKLSPTLLLRVERHADRYGDRLVRLRVTAYEWNRGMRFSGEEHLTLPTSSLGAVIGALQRARAAMEARQSSQSHVSRSPVRRDNEARQPAAQQAKALELHAAGKKPEEIAAELRVGRATVYRWLRRSVPVTNTAAPSTTPGEQA
jgi:hypothetical protein